MVSITALRRPWGELQVLPNGAAVLRHVHLSAGGRWSPWGAMGHAVARPMVRCLRATLLLSGALLSDAVGKGVAAQGCRVTFHDTAFARLAMGAELHGSCLEARRCHVSQLPRWGAGRRPRREDDDNDGFYLRESLPATASHLDVKLCKWMHRMSRIQAVACVHDEF